MGSAVPKAYDVLVIGAGPAGLSLALGLARQTYSALVFDSHQYRNANAERIHNVVTWDHRRPVEFRATGQANIASQYRSIQFRDATVTSATKTEDGSFEVTDNTQQTFSGKKLVLAVGVTDVMLDIPGFADLWGRSIFHCLFCHGFEERGAESAGIMAAGFINKPPMVLHMARMAAPLAKHVTVYCNGDSDVAAAMEKEFEGRPLTVEARKISKLEEKDEHGTVKVHFDDGEVKEERFLVSVPPTKNNGPFVEQLGIELEPMGHIKVTPPFNETSVPGVFAVGDCATMMKAAPQAIAMGSFGAAGVVAQVAPGLGKL